MLFEGTAPDVPVADGTADVDDRLTVDEGLLDIIEEVDWRTWDEERREPEVVGKVVWGKNCPEVETYKFATAVNIRTRTLNLKDCWLMR
jgi:hypothetical protein